MRPSATLFIRYMVLLFVPVSVGLMEHFDMLYANVFPVLASVIGGSFIVLITLGLMLDRMLRGTINNVVNLNLDRIFISPMD